VKSEFKIHNSVVFLDKNIENLCGSKFLISLGYDEKIDFQTKQITEKALVLKIWDFISLDSKCFSFLKLNKYFIDRLFVIY
jgi:hypothetical protein